MDHSTNVDISNLSTDGLRQLKEGEILVNEDGKKYRVKKTILPQKSISGPCGIGDPEDRSLRKIEADVVIPNMMNKQLEQTECRTEIEGVVSCIRREGGALGLRRCKDMLNMLNACKKKYFEDSAFRQRVTDAYLEERANARRTGLTAKQRKLEEYRKWKRDNSEQPEA